MFNCWKNTTIVFVSQVLVSLIVYAFTDNLRMVVLACAYTGLIFLPISIVNIINGNHPPSSDFPVLAASSLIATVATICFFAAGISAINDEVHDVIAAVVMVAVFTFLFTGLDTKEESDSFFLRYIAFLPLGIGTVLGGLILLMRKRKQITA